MNKNNIINKQQQNSSTRQHQQNSSVSSSTTNSGIPCSPDAAVGARITLSNVLNEVIEGEIYAYDPTLQLIALYESGGQHESSTRKTFRLINMNTVQVLKFDSSSKTYVPFSNISLPLPPVNLDRLSEREQKACYEREQNLGSGVSNDAQQLFDNLAKTLPCKWDNDVIVVLDVIRISSPYGLDSVVGGDVSSKTRVKKVENWRNFKERCEK
ncbi:hypothetical protein AKO1_009769 [Acrasis kona]|uniref:AD domain-containing protein n=1 Tax=Acrasis kona TaxID=1008807 RepID=A0AAW2ZNB8_9EUKA